MSALTSWIDEHQRILELLGALHVYATRLRAGASVDVADLERFSELCRELVDYRHHEKEEGILLPLLARNGCPWSSGLLAGLRREHRHLRHLIDVLSQAAARGTLGGREQRRRTAEAALAFVELERVHIFEEEHALSPLIERLGPGAVEQLGAEFAQFDEASGRSLESARALASARELVQRFVEDPAGSDVTEVRWTAAAQASQAARHEPPALSAFGRSR